MGAGALIAGLAFLMIVLKLWLAAAILGGSSVVLFVLGSMLMLRADKNELMELSRRNEHRLDAWAQGMARISGGWGSSGGRRDQHD